MEMVIYVPFTMEEQLILGVMLLEDGYIIFYSSSTVLNLTLMLLQLLILQTVTAITLIKRLHVYFGRNSQIQIYSIASTRLFQKLRFLLNESKLVMSSMEGPNLICHRRFASYNICRENFEELHELS